MNKSRVNGQVNGQDNGQVNGQVNGQDNTALVGLRVQSKSRGLRTSL